MERERLGGGGVPGLDTPPHRLARLVKSISFAPFFFDSFSSLSLLFPAAVLSLLTTRPNSVRCVHSSSFFLLTLAIYCKTINPTSIFVWLPPAPLLLGRLCSVCVCFHVCLHACVQRTEVFECPCYIYFVCIVCDHVYFCV